MRALLKCTVAIAALSAAGIVAAPVAKAKNRFISFDAPGAALTFVADMNNKSVIAGSWDDSTGLSHGFSRAADGTMQTFDAPGASEGTYSTAINTAGTIAGCYYADDQVPFGHAFLRTPDGNVQNIDDPNGSNGTCALDINAARATIGLYTSDTLHAFERAADGTFIDIDVFGAAETDAAVIGNSGTVAGEYFDAKFKPHGFIRSSDGMIADFKIPAKGVEEIDVHSINVSGAICGAYYTPNATHGFIRDAGGTVTSLDIGGSSDTKAFSIDDLGDVAGRYADDAGYHGFLRTPDGQVTTFDVPGSSNTYVAALNKRGFVAGDYDKDGATHGYLWKR